MLLQEHPDPNTVRLGALGSYTRGLYYTFVFIFTLSTLLVLYEETPSYLNKRVVRSFNLPYVALLQNIPTNHTPPLPTVTSS